MRLNHGWWLLSIAPMVMAFPGASQAKIPEGVDLAALQDWDVVVDEAASPSELYAAEELSKHIARATDVHLPTVTSIGRKKHHIFVGPGKLMAASNVGFDTGRFGEEDLRIVIRDGNIAIAGGEPRGTLYGVYTFLEDYLGVRFLTTTHTHVPKVGGWRVVGPVDRSYRPPLRMRWSYYGETNTDPMFAARLRVNTVGGEPRYGGTSGLGLINHSFGRQLPTATYGKEHPEYFAEVDGQRLAQVKDDWYGTQPCLTNPDVLKIVTDAVLAELASNPGKMNISVSQNDNEKYCRCAECRAIDEAEGSPMGSLLTFVNAVAEAVEKQHPNVLVGTLSYQYSRTPPKTIRPRGNVMIQLCSIECCVLHPIGDGACLKNRRFYEDLEGWGAICNRIAIWNYNTNFSDYLLPFPNLEVIEPNVRLFVGRKAVGVFMQAAGNTVAAEFSDLRNYVMGRLLWNPSLSGKALVNEFLELHYGKAAPPLRRFIEQAHARASTSGLHPNCFGKPEDYAIDEGIRRAAREAFGEAMQLADSEEVRKRVEKASLIAHRLNLELFWRAGGIEGLDSVTAAQHRSALLQFFSLARRNGLTRIREATSLDEFVERY